MDPKTNLITTLKELKAFIEEGDLDQLKANINRFHQDLECNKQELEKLSKSGDQGATQTALILAACSSNQADILYYLLYETDILNYIPSADFDNKDVQMQRTEAFKLALNCDAFNMVEMLYDYWSGDLHWIVESNTVQVNTVRVNKLTMLGKMLKDAHDPNDVKNQQLLIDMNCLIKFNDFQQKLYSSITNISPEKTAAEMLVEVLRIYDEYSDEHKVRIPHVNEEIEREQKASLDDKISECFRMQFYLKYTVYFRKLDFNVALLILDNWFILRKQFRVRFNQPKEYFTDNPAVKSSYEKAVSLYKDIECILFHFIYRTWDDWRLYLPRKRYITVEEHHTGVHKGKIIENLIIKYDEHTWNNGPVLFLERKSFCDHVKKLKTLLEENIISVDPAKNLMQNHEMKKSSADCILLDHNYLTPTDTNTSTNNPSYISTNTYMRDFYSLSKIVYYIKAIENTKDSDDNDANNDIDDDDILMIERVLQVTGEMLKSSPASNHLSDSAKSLLQIAISIDTVKHLSNIRDFLSHSKNGRLGIRDDTVKSNRKLFHDIRQDLIIIRQRITPVLEIFKEILDKSLLEQGLTLLDKRIENLPHKQHIEHYYKIHGLKLIDSETSKPLIERLNDDTKLSIELLTEIIWIHFNRDSILQKKELAKESIGKKIINILPIYIQNIRQAIDKNNKNVNLINQEIDRCNIKKMKKGMPDNPDHVTTTIAKMRLQFENMKTKDKKPFIDYDKILLTLNDIKDFSGLGVAIGKMLSFCYDECDGLGPKPQIQNNVLSVTTILKELDEKCKSNKNVVSSSNHTFDAIKNLNVIFEEPKGSGIKRDQIKSFLIRRVDCLKRILKCSQEKNLRKYKNDQKFRLLLEMVLADIGNIFAECKRNDLMKKSNMLLREINLGNVLDHGNPFLDVIAEVFDPYDHSMGLVSKAEMLVVHGDSIIQNLP